MSKRVVRPETPLSGHFFEKLTPPSRPEGPKTLGTKVSWPTEPPRAATSVAGKLQNHRDGAVAVAGKSEVEDDHVRVPRHTHVSPLATLFTPRVKGATSSVKVYL